MKRINLAATKEDIPIRPLKLKKKMWKKFSLIAIIGFLILVLLLLWMIFKTTSSVVQFNFLKPDPIKSTNGRVNVLLLGNAGGKHDGAELTDSIIIASYQLDTGNVTLISIPRDLYLKNIKQKINAAYELGELDKNGGNGLKFAEDKIDDILGFPIHYGVRINFDGFAKAIDLVEGIDVNVPKTFDDYEYPITGKENDLCGYKEEDRDLSAEDIQKLNLPSPLPAPLPTELAFLGSDPTAPGKRKVLISPDGQIATQGADFACRYEHISFKKGTSHMDGTTALKFVRSRHGTAGEGSDFARSRRQQLVIQAFREKAFSLQTLSNPAKLGGLLSTFGDNVETDIPGERLLDFYNLAKKVGNIQSIVLGDINGKSLLINPPLEDYGGAWVLTAPNDDFTQVQKYLQDQLNGTSEASASVSPK